MKQFVYFDPRIAQLHPNYIKIGVVNKEQIVFTSSREAENKSEIINYLERNNIPHFGIYEVPSAFRDFWQNVRGLNIQELANIKQ